MRDERRPVFDGPGHHAHVDVGEGPVFPGVFDVVDFEFEVGRDPGEGLVSRGGDGGRGMDQPGWMGERSEPMTWASGCWLWYVRMR